MSQFINLFRIDDQAVKHKEIPSMAGKILRVPNCWPYQNKVMPIFRNGLSFKPKDTNIPIPMITTINEIGIRQRKAIARLRFRLGVLSRVLIIFGIDIVITPPRIKPIAAAIKISLKSDRFRRFRFLGCVSR